MLDNEKYLDVELQIKNCEQARLSFDGRQFDAEINLGEDLYKDLLILDNSFQFEDYGDVLFKAMIPPGSTLQEGLHSALERARLNQYRIRFRLNLEFDVDLKYHSLHWELMSYANSSFSRDIPAAFSRYHSLPHDHKSPKGRRRLLCIIAAPTNIHRRGTDPAVHDGRDRNAMPPIAYDLVHDKLEKIFKPLNKDVDVDFLPRPTTPERVREFLSTGKYHLVHIHGHGTVSSDGCAALMLENDDHEVEILSETRLEGILLGIRELQIVTIIACRGGEITSQSDRFSGLAGRLVRGGIPAVIAMKGSVSMDLGMFFTEHLYRRLATSFCIDAAVSEARHQIYIRDPQCRELVNPILYMRLRGRSDEEKNHQK